MWKYHSDVVQIFQYLFIWNKSIRWFDDLLEILTQNLGTTVHYVCIIGLRKVQTDGSQWKKVNRKSIWIITVKKKINDLEIRKAFFSVLFFLLISSCKKTKKTMLPFIFHKVFDFIHFMFWLFLNNKKLVLCQY
jgi:hypothetical protein